MKNPAQLPTLDPPPIIPRRRVLEVRLGNGRLEVVPCDPLEATERAAEGFR